MGDKELGLGQQMNWDVPSSPYLNILAWVQSEVSVHAVINYYTPLWSISHFSVAPTVITKQSLLGAVLRVVWLACEMVVMELTQLRRSC